MHVCRDGRPLRCQTGASRSMCRFPSIARRRCFAPVPLPKSNPAGMVASRCIAKFHFLSVPNRLDQQCPLTARPSTLEGNPFKQNFMPPKRELWSFQGFKLTFQGFLSWNVWLDVCSKNAGFPLLPLRPFQQSLSHQGGPFRWEIVRDRPRWPGRCKDFPACSEELHVVVDR